MDQLPIPNDRVEALLYAIATGDTSDLPTPKTREEKLLLCILNKGNTQYDGAGYHNSVYRGQYLGDHVTEAQKQAIKDGTFRDLFVGDYWTINGVNYRIAAFNYYYNKSQIVRFKKNHVVLVTDTPLYNHVFNDTDTTSGGYANSKMRTEGLNQAKEIIGEAFENLVLSRKAYLINSIDSDGKANGAGWYDSTVELMSEIHLFGSFICEGSIQRGCHAYTNDTTQFPLFAFDQTTVSPDSGSYWLRNICSSNKFSLVNLGGTIGIATADLERGVRPMFIIG